MGTKIESISIARPRRWDRTSALHLAVKAGRDALAAAGRSPCDVDLLINAGIYRDRSLGEPALAPLIQAGIGINAGDPRPDSTGTLSFDVANGSCGVLTALQIADGFLHAGTVQTVLVVTSDADPGHGLAPRFP